MQEKVIVRTQEVRDSRVTESHAELQQEQGRRREEKKGSEGEGRVEVMVRTQEVRDSRVTESHVELQQEQEQEQG